MASANLLIFNVLFAVSLWRGDCFMSCEFVCPRSSQRLLMNPNSILARETRLPAQATRRQQATRADFQLPEPAADAQERRMSAARDRDDRMAMKIDRSRPEQADHARGPRSEDLRGSDRSREVRRDEFRRDGEARDDQPGKGEGPERRSARAEEVSSRDKVKQPADDCCEATTQGEPQPAAEQPVSTEAAALELLAKAEAEATTGASIKAPDDKAASPDAPVEGTVSPGVEAPATEPVALQVGLPPAGSAATGAEPLASAGKAEPGPSIGENGAGSPRTAAPHPAAKGGELKDAVAEQKSLPGEATDPAAAQEKPDASGKAPAESAQTATRPAHEAKAEAVQGQFQSAAARLEALPPGLAALPDNARALQAQLSETKPQSGAHPHGARGPETAPTSLSALPIEIGFRALEGTKRFDIRLDPAELGRVDVSLSFDKDGEVTAKLTVDRVETLHLLQRDAKTLERAFDQAGLRTSDAGVQISLSDRNAGQGGGQAGDFQADQDRARGAGRRDEAEASSPITEIIPQRRLRLGGVDVNI
jgi:flagellar hook-length control protein FliK